MGANIAEILRLIAAVSSIAQSISSNSNAGSIQQAFNLEQLDQITRITADQFAELLGEYVRESYGRQARGYASCIFPSGLFSSTTATDDLRRTVDGLANLGLSDNKLELQIATAIKDYIRLPINQQNGFCLYLMRHMSRLHGFSQTNELAAAARGQNENAPPQP